jgi:AcrR family transcriptional regulator
MARPSLKALQSERTQAALIAAGRQLFAARGYAGVSAEEVAAAAGVTTGAVYHQFESKRGLFVAVFEAVEAEVTAAVGAAAGAASDPWEGFIVACERFLELAGEPAVRQILLVDGRSILGWDEWHAIMARYGLGMTRAVVEALTAAGRLPKLPLDALTALLFGALNEGAAFVAGAPDSEAAVAEMKRAWRGLLESITP